MPRSSSSSASTPSRITPPSRATAGGSSTSVAIELVAQVGEIVELGDQARDERRLQLGQEHAHARHGGNRLPQRDQIARPGDAERRARDEPLDVVNRLERLAQLGALGRPERELFDGVEPILNPLERDQRPEQPRRAAAGRPSTSSCDRSRAAATRSARRRRLRAPRGCASVVASTSRQSAPARNAISRTCARSAFCVSRR